MLDKTKLEKINDPTRGNIPCFFIVFLDAHRPANIPYHVSEFSPFAKARVCVERATPPTCHEIIQRGPYIQPYFKTGPSTPPAIKKNAKTASFNLRTLSCFFSALFPKLLK
jgi:hypothetical protein